MTASITDLLLYAGALFFLFLTPGPVWVALIARTISGGFNSAWPLALGVVVGDVIWPIVAIFSVSYVASVYADFLVLLKYAATGIFVVLGVNLIRNASNKVVENATLTAPGVAAGFLAGLAVILSNPKAILFYMGVLPGFFDLAALTTLDIVAICTLSLLVPLIGNLGLAVFVNQVRAAMSSDRALRRINLSSGVALILVGVAIAFT
jgi:threonine/homoserine/homoserine lactone efflux protein